MRACLLTYPQNKIEIRKGLMDCLYAKTTPYITDCVMAELEKLGPKFRVALRVGEVNVAAAIQPAPPLFLIQLTTGKSG